MRILIVEDETRLAETLRQLMEDQRYQADMVGDGADGVDYGLTGQYDLIILDVMLPKVDGFEVARRLRSAHISTPILMLTARDDISDKIGGLDCGADDYMTKPFSPAELTARIDALYRRIDSDGSSNQIELKHGPFVLNTRNRTLDKDGRRIKLTQVEYAIVKLFMQNPGRALSREDILAAVWGRDYDGELKIVDVNIRRLRIKIEDDTASPTYITTVWGFGYKWGA